MRNKFLLLGLLMLLAAAGCDNTANDRKFAEVDKRLAAVNKYLAEVKADLAEAHYNRDNDAVVDKRLAEVKTELAEAYEHLAEAYRLLDAERAERDEVERELAAIYELLAEVEAIAADVGAVHRNRAEFKALFDGLILALYLQQQRRTLSRDGIATKDADLFERWLELKGTDAERAALEELIRSLRAYAHFEYNH